MGSGRGDECSGKEVPTFLINPLGGNRGNTLTVNVTKEVVSARSWGKIITRRSREGFGRKKLGLLCLYSALPEEVSHLLWNS